MVADHPWNSAAEISVDWSAGLSSTRSAQPQARRCPRGCSLAIAGTRTAARRNGAAVETRIPPAVESLPGRQLDQIRAAARPSQPAGRQAPGRRARSDRADRGKPDRRRGARDPAGWHRLHQAGRSPVRRAGQGWRARAPALRRSGRRADLGGAARGRLQADRAVPENRSRNRAPRTGGEPCRGWRTAPRGRVVVAGSPGPAATARPPAPAPGDDPHQSTSRPYDGPTCHAGRPAAPQGRVARSITGPAPPCQVKR